MCVGRRIQILLCMPIFAVFAGFAGFAKEHYESPVSPTAGSFVRLATKKIFLMKIARREIPLVS